MGGLSNVTRHSAGVVRVTLKRGEVNRPGLDGDLGYATSVVEATV